MKRFVLVALWVLALSVSAQAGIYNNTGTTSEDSIGITFTALDTLGNPVDIVAGDSVYLMVFYPGGKLAFRDSIAGNNAQIVSETWADYAGGGSNTYFNSVAAIDATPQQGTYKYTLIVHDVSLSLHTPHHGEFQLYETAAFTTWADALADTANAILDTLQLQDGWVATSANQTLIVDTVNAVLDTLQNQDDWVAQEATGVDVTAIDGTAAAATNLEKAFDGASGSRADPLWLTSINVKTSGAQDTALVLWSSQAGAGHGLIAIGGSGSGSGIVGLASDGSNGKGLHFIGDGSGAAVRMQADPVGGTGVGLQIDGGATSGNGVTIASTSGNGVDINAASGDGLEIDGTTADIDANITGTLATVTNSTQAETDIAALNNFDPTSDSVIVDVSSASAASGLLANAADSVWDGPVTRDLTTPGDYKADVSALALEASLFDNTTDSVIVDVSSATAADGLLAKAADSVWDGGLTRDLTTPGDYKADVSALALEASLYDPTTDSVIVDVSSASAADGLLAKAADSVWDGGLTRDLTTPGDYKADVSSLALEASLYDPTTDSVIVDVSSAAAADGLMAKTADSVWDGGLTRDLTTPGDYKADVSALALEASLFDNTTDSVIVDVSSASAASGLLANTADSVWDGPVTRDLTTPGDYKADVSSLFPLSDTAGLAVNIADAVWNEDTTGHYDLVKYGYEATGSGGSGATAAQVRTQVDEAHDSLRLDHLALTADADDVVNATILAEMASSDGDWSGFDNTTDALEALRDRGDAAWTTGGGFGSGAKTVTIYAVDTSGTNANVAWQGITVSTKAGVQVGVKQFTDSDGLTTWNLDASTDYLVTGTGTGYIWASNDTMTTDAGGGGYTDSTQGYDLAATNTTPGVQMTTLNDWAEKNNVALEGAKVKVTLTGSDMFYTSTDLVPSVTITVVANSAGYWEVALFGTDSLSAPGSGVATYEVEIDHGDLDTPITYTGLTIPANGSTTRLRAIVAAQ